MNTVETALPASFIKRRLHSLTGLFLVLFLFEHLLVNSQAAFFLSDYGIGFVQAANSIQSLPYLPVIELALLGAPILLHGYYGIIYLFSAKINSMHTDGRTPDLTSYSKNHAYTWQRITALILVVGLALHVITMRFLDRPEVVQRGATSEYLVKVNDETKVVDSFGAAELLIVRETFKSLMPCILYTIFVLAACFHAMNGVWTFAISWGITLSEKSRLYTRRFSDFVMLLIVFFGLAAIWGTYFSTR